MPLVLLQWLYNLEEYCLFFEQFEIDILLRYLKASMQIMSIENLLGKGLVFLLSCILKEELLQCFTERSLAFTI